jgi:hypothetical protein
MSKDHVDEKRYPACDLENLTFLLKLVDLFTHSDGNMA